MRENKNYLYLSSPILMHKRLHILSSLSFLQLRNHLPLYPVILIQLQLKDENISESPQSTSGEVDLPLPR